MTFLQFGDVIKTYSTNTFMKLLKTTLIAGFLPGLILCMASCKKNSGEEPLPVFGTCQAVPAKGHLSYTNPGGPYTFRTNGGGTITISELGQIIIKHDNYPGFSIEFWGGDANPANKMSASHENLNGKHIKDRERTRRTFIFPDGAKITFAAPPPFQPLTFISIYDGAEVHHINPVCNTVEYSAVNASIAQQLDDAEEDGETSTIEISAEGLLWNNIYTEDSPGNKVMNLVPLGELRRDSPSLVRDFYDDPRLGHT